MEKWHKGAGTAGLAILILLATVTGATAFFGGSKGGPGGPFDLKMLMDLELTDAQKIELAELLDKSGTEALHQQMQAARERFDEAMRAQPLDEARIREAFRQMTPAMEEMAVHRAKSREAFRAVLTESQSARIEKRRNEQKERMQEHRRFGKQMVDTWLGMTER